MRPFSIWPWVALLFLAGCTAPRGSSANAYQGREGDPDLEAVAGNRALLRDLEIVRYHSRRENDRLHVQFDLRNKRGSDLGLEWRMDWFDATGFKIDTAEHWTPLVIGGKAFETIAAIGPTPSASAFQLQTRTRSTVH